MSIAAGGGAGNSGADHQGVLPPQVMRFDVDQNVGYEIRQLHDAVAKKVPEIADPVIQKAQEDGKITSDQADKLRAAAQAIADGKRPDLDRTVLDDSDVRTVIRDALDAVRKAAP